MNRTLSAPRGPAPGPTLIGLMLNWQWQIFLSRKQTDSLSSRATFFLFGIENQWKNSLCRIPLLSGQNSELLLFPSAATARVKRVQFTLDIGTDGVAHLIAVGTTVVGFSFFSTRPVCT